MAQDFVRVGVRAFVGLLASLALSSGMLILEKGNTGLYTPPPSSIGNSISPEENPEGSGAYIPHTAPPFPGRYPWPEGNNPQIRDAFSMSQYETQMPNNPPLPKGFTPQRSLPDSSLPAGDFTDMSYCNMILEAPIPPTADQVPWFCTCTLCKGGSTGPKGDRGDRGLPGQPGSPGRRGLTGLQGSPGFIGHPGMKGQKGDEGVKGNQGPIGLMGMKGEQGYKGDKGDLGMDGRPGVQGPPGEPGQCPASCESPPGSPGEVGLPGIVGPRGIPGNEGTPGMKGQKGDKGEVGMPGLPGLEGRKGDQGEQGLCNCKDGAKGANGSQGSMGPKGDKGDAGSQGHEGVAGLKGEKGDLGMKGPPGPCTPAIQSAFSARLAFNYPKPNLPVPFTDVIFNVQFHFDPTLGVYTAPVNGTYVFSYHLVVSLKTLKVGLFHNFQPVVKTTDSPNVGTASQHIVLHLNRFDRVWLQVKDSNTNGMFANSESSSTFSGFLLYPDNCDEPFFRDFPVFSNDETYDWGNLPNVTTPDP